MIKLYVKDGDTKMFFSRDDLATMASINDISNGSRYFTYAEILSPEDNGDKQSKEMKELRKDKSAMVRILKTFRRECDDMITELKNRIRAIRNNTKANATEFEPKMYQTVQSLMTTKLQAIKQESDIRMKTRDLEMKQRKLEYDLEGKVPGSIGGNGSDGSDMKMAFANYIMNGDPDIAQIGKLPISAPEGGTYDSVDDYTNSTGKSIGVPEPKDENKEDVIVMGTPVKKEVSEEVSGVTKSVDIDVEKKDRREPKDEDVEVKEEMKIRETNYEYAMMNAKNIDRIGEEILHIDEENDVYWLEVRDVDGNLLKPDEVRHKHIEILGDISIDEKEGEAMDVFSNTYKMVKDNMENMPEYYRAQWVQRGKIDPDLDDLE